MHQAWYAAKIKRKKEQKIRADAKRTQSTLSEDDVDAMATKFSELFNEALNECAHMKSFTTKTGYIPGLSAETKQMMSDREGWKLRAPMETGELQKVQKSYKIRKTVEMI